jgi:hypothetical protein
MRVVYVCLNLSTAPAKGGMTLRAPHLVTTVDFENGDGAFGTHFRVGLEQTRCFDVFLFAYMTAFRMSLSYYVFLFFLFFFVI